MSDRRALLIVNAKSRSGALILENAQAELRAHGIEPLHRESPDREAMSPLIVAHAGEVDRVVIAGGDGTLNAAARGIIETGLPLGILPAGTANDLARTLGIPEDCGEAARIIADGHTRRIDMGLVNEHPFFNVASIGLSAELARRLTREVKRRYGRFGYALTALAVLAQARPFRAFIANPNERARRVKTLQIAVGNGRYYGGGMAVEKDAAIDDGHLDLYSLEFQRAWKLALMARSFRYGEHGAWKEVRAIRDTAFEIRTRKPRSVNADGEIVTQTPARFAVMEKALTVFAPRDGAQA
jgi:diacylglycerol kinase (ATP)